MMRDRFPVSILYFTKGPYATLGREAVKGLLAAITEINSNPASHLDIVPQIEPPCGQAAPFAVLALSAIRDGGCRHVKRSAVMANICDALHQEEELF